MGRESRLNPFGTDTTVSLPAIVRDAYGREIAVEDMVQLHELVPPVFQVESISPVMDPGQPPNLMTITVRARMQFMAQRNGINQEFVRVLTKAEVDAAKPPKAEAEEKKDRPFSVVRPGETIADDALVIEEPGA